MEKAGPATPCGLIAKSFFNDTFILRKENGNTVDILENNIAWASDVQFRFGNVDPMDVTPAVDSWNKAQWLDMTDEHFIVWMRTAALPNFRKLWGRIPDDVESGTYTLSIENNFDVADFNGQKGFLMSNANGLGGKNTFLGYLYIFIGVIAFALAIGFYWAYENKK